MSKTQSLFTYFTKNANIFVFMEKALHKAMIKRVGEISCIVTLFLNLKSPM